MAAECGGTITLQKRVEIGGVLQDVPADSRWNFSTDIGDRLLDRSVTASVTLDYAFNTGQASKDRADRRGRRTGRVRVRSHRVLEGRRSDQRAGDGPARLVVQRSSVMINRRVSTPATRGSEGVSIRTENLGVARADLQVPRDIVQQGEYPCVQSSRCARTTRTP
jgi:hypothetical protein